MVTLILVAAGAWYTRPYWRQTAQVTPTTPAPAPAPAPLQPASQPATRPEEDTSHLPPSVFDKTDARRTRRAAAATRPTTAVAMAPRRGSRAPSPDEMDTEPAPGSSPDSTDMTDGAGQDAADAAPPPISAQASPSAPPEDAAWKQVQVARYSPDEAGAIVKFDDYARSHPGQFSAELEALTEKALDRIWFERIEQLCKSREELKAKIAEVDKDLAEESNDAYKKRVLAPLKEQYAGRLKSVEDVLTGEMKYTAAATPNLVDDAELERLRKQRDAGVYTAWKTSVLAHIRRTHGELPWVSEKNS